MTNPYNQKPLLDAYIQAATHFPDNARRDEPS